MLDQSRVGGIQRCGRGRRWRGLRGVLSVKLSRHNHTSAALPRPLTSPKVRARGPRLLLELRSGAAGPAGLQKGVRPAFWRAGGRGGRPAAPAAAGRGGWDSTARRPVAARRRPAAAALPLPPSAAAHPPPSAGRFRKHFLRLSASVIGHLFDTGGARGLRCRTGAAGCACKLQRLPTCPYYRLFLAVGLSSRETCGGGQHGSRTAVLPLL